MDVGIKTGTFRQAGRWEVALESRFCAFAIADQDKK
jgi:hypothetical protein